jgi:hypothetical protein
MTDTTHTFDTSHYTRAVLILTNDEGTGTQLDINLDGTSTETHLDTEVILDTDPTTGEQRPTSANLTFAVMAAPSVIVEHVGERI